MLKANGHQRTKSRRKTGDASDGDQESLWYNRFKMEKEKHQQKREENQKKEEEIERLKLSVQNLCVMQHLFCLILSFALFSNSSYPINLNREKVNAFLRHDLKHSTDGNPLKSKLFL